MAENHGEENGGVCPKCGSPHLIRDYTLARVMCADCGYVIREGIKDRGPEWRAFDQEQKESKSRAGPPITPTMHDKGLSTDIPRTNRDAKGNLISPDRRAEIERMRKWHNRAKFDKNHSWTLKNALTTLSRVCSQKGFSSRVRGRASRLYRDASKADIVRGRPSEAAVAAVLYLACVELGRPVSLEEIAETAGVTKKETQRVHWLIIRELEIEAPLLSPAKYVPVVIRSVESGEAGRKVPQEVRRDARRIAREVEKRKLMQGRRMDVVAATAVFLAVEYRSYNIPIWRVADSLGLAHSTVKRAVNDMGRGLGHDFLTEIVNDSEGG